MASSTPTHKRSTPNSVNIGATTGTTMKMISMKSIKKPAINTPVITMTKKSSGCKFA